MKNSQNIIKKIDFNKIIENPNELNLYKKITEKILIYLINNGPTRFNTIIKNVGASDRRTLRLLNQLVSIKVILFKKGKFFLDIPKKTINCNELLCPSCEGKIITINGKLKKIASLTKKIFLKRPKPTFIFDQRPVTYETTMRRVAYLIWRGDIQNKKIVILGDDDLTSIPLALTKLAKEIIVFDVDKRLINFINNIANKFKLPLKAVYQDLTKQIPNKYKKYFDVFISDPTPTKIPFSIFTNQGIKLLKRGKTPKVGYLSMYSSGMDRNYKLQHIFTERNLMITDLIPFFTQYAFIKETYSPQDLKLLKKYSNNNSKLSFYESLVRIETTSKTKTLKINYNRTELFGKATKRVLKNLDKDPALKNGSEKEKRYIKSIFSDFLNMEKNQNKNEKQICH